MSLLKVITDKTNDKKFLSNLIEKTIFGEMNAITDFTTTRYQNFLYIFEELFAVRSPKILTILLALLFEPPFTTCQIEVITNNSEIIGPELFKAFTNRSGIDILIDAAL